MRRRDRRVSLSRIDARSSGSSDMNLRMRWPLLAALLLMAGCASTQQPSGATFVVVRHAEKGNDDLQDPALSVAGQARAEALAVQLRDAPLTAIYATSFRRAQQTAAPVARTHHIDVQTYDGKLPAPEFASQLRRAHASGIVLVVGHSNTVPDIAAALCGCAVEPMEETEYDRRMTVRVLADGTARLTVDRGP
jgi:phosphohistidine phosphatase SixA